MRKIEIIPGTKFQEDSKLTVISEATPRRIQTSNGVLRTKRMILCHCICGCEDRAYSLEDLKSGRIKGCGKCRPGMVSGLTTRDLVEVVCQDCNISSKIQESKRRGNIKRGGYEYKCRSCSSLGKPGTKKNTLVDLEGIEFGSLKVLSELPSHETPGGKLLRRFHTICECGTNREVLLMHLRSGKIRSCGCVSESQPEKEIYHFVKSILPEDTKVIRHDKLILGGQELDLFLPDLKLAIEFNGLHWHSEFVCLSKDNTHPGKDRYYHLEKTKKCAEKGIQLLHIWEDEWRDRQEQVKTRIINLLHLSPKGVFARKTNLVGVTTHDKENFYWANHIQGGCSSTRDLGLEYEGELVAVMSFKIRTKEGLSWELVRFATSMNVVGGFSKLLKAFQRNNEWSEIISFADLAWSNGALYEKTGWMLDKTLSPDYKYVVGKYRKHKFGYRHAGGGMKKKLEVYDRELSELQNMLNNKIYRIYDCGKIRYKLISKSIYK